MARLRQLIDANGQTNYEAKSLNDLIDEFNASHPDIHVQANYIGSNDNAYQKLTVALQGGDHRTSPTSTGPRWPRSPTRRASST